MFCLGLDTSGSQCSVSIVDYASVRAHLCKDIGRGHAEVLAGMVDEALERAALRPDQIGRVAVCTGPGSFTGLRVALSFAQGFALPKSLPIIGMNALDAEALNHMGGGKRVIFRDVRREEIMCAGYIGAAPLSSPRLRRREDITGGRVALTEAGPVDTRLLAWRAMDLSPQTHPAEPLYARGPDAKLPAAKKP